jgi:cytochrome c oxidase assembly factor CtaG
MAFGVLAWLLVAEGLYLRAVRTLAARGHTVPRGQLVCWHVGIGLQAVGLLSPIGAYADDLLSAHMAEHLLIADLAAPFLVAGVRTPVLQFLLPRQALVPLARRRRLRRALAVARRPQAAIPLYLLVLYGWHLGPLFEAATTSPALHALQHMTFVATGILVWWPLLEPGRRRMTGALWKILHILGARLAGMMLGMAFIISRTPFYTDVYGAGDRALGFSALADQQSAGAIMLIVDILLMVCAMAFLFWRAAAEEDRRAASYSTVSVPSMPPSRWPGTEQ